MAATSVNLTNQIKFSLAKVTSGFGSGTIGPLTVNDGYTVTSGKVYAVNNSIASGQTFSFDLVSGGLTDLLGDTASMSQVVSVQVLALSGNVGVNFCASGGTAFYGHTSGTPWVPFGGSFCHTAPGNSGGWQLSAAQGNIQLSAVSGAAQGQAIVYGF